MITLALDASTYTGDVALLRDTTLLAEMTTAMKGVHEERLMPAVEQALAAAGVSVGQIDRVVCGAGPGSFTSLRIGGAIAKGIATGIGRPLYAVPSMALVAGGAGLAPGLYLVAVDALRGEFYVGLYEVERNRCTREIERARLVSRGDVGPLASELGASLVSPSRLDGAVEARPRARAVATLEALLGELGAVEVASWEPAYGRLAEAQVKWESTHGRPLPAG